MKPGPAYIPGGGGATWVVPTALPALPQGWKDVTDLVTPVTLRTHASPARVALYGAPRHWALEERARTSC